MLNKTKIELTVQKNLHFSEPTQIYTQVLDKQQEANLNLHLYHLYCLLIKNGSPYKKASFKKFLLAISQKLSCPQDSGRCTNSTKLIFNTILDDFSPKHYSIKLKNQQINHHLFKKYLTTLLEHLQKNQNPELEEISKIQKQEIGEAINIIIGSRVKGHEKYLLSELIGKLLSYQTKLDKFFMSKIFSFDEAGLYKYRVEYIKALKQFYYIKEEKEFTTIKGQQIHDFCLDDHSEIQAFFNLQEEKLNLLNQSVWIGDEESYLEESQVFSKRSLSNQSIKSTQRKSIREKSSLSSSSIKDKKKLPNLSLKKYEQSEIEDNPLEFSPLINIKLKRTDSLSLSIIDDLHDSKNGQIWGVLQKKLLSSPDKVENLQVKKDEDENSTVTNSGRSRRESKIRRLVDDSILGSAQLNKKDIQSQMIEKNIKKGIFRDLIEEEKLRQIGLKLINKRPLKPEGLNSS